MSTTATSGSTMIDRMIRAAKLENAVYEEVEHDQSATVQAFWVVVIASVAAGIGGLGAGLTGLIVGVIAALVGWAAYAYVCYWIGTRVLAGPQTSATWGQLLRTLGFASSPRVLLVLAFIPVIGLLLAIVVLIWTFLTTVVAIRQALDFDTGRAIVTAIAGWAVLFLTTIVVAALVVGAT